MTTEEMLEMAALLGLPVNAETFQFSEQSEISSVIRHTPPYLLLTHALCGRASGSSVLFVFARATFSERECDGHYPGFPSLPLTEIGRAMDQTAALFAGYAASDSAGAGKIPLLRRIAKLKGGRIEKFDPVNPCWIWASTHNGELRTTLFSGSLSSPLASIEGWTYDFKNDNEFQSSLSENLRISPDVSFARLDRGNIMKLIPQAPPFLILESATITHEQNGHATISAHAHVLPEMKAGYLGRNKILGPMHCSRALAQSGMVLCAATLPLPDFIPEVGSAYNIWYDTSCYFRNQNEVTVLARIEHLISKKSLNMAKVSGSVFCNGREIYGAESLNYILIPRDDHPAGRSNQ
jgi:3-hydroxymyristoyl/3-hydroxydecanoyl-(acyl carrier protein) dehydratase